MTAPRAGLLGVAVLALGGVLLVPSLRGAPAPTGPPVDRSAPVVVTALPGLVPATGDPVLEGFATARPRPGTTAAVQGPFDDRFELSGTRYADGTASGVVTVTSDVSEVVDLQVVVGFYDADGDLLGTGAWEAHGEGEGEGEGAPDERLAYAVPAPASFRDRVAATAVGVPVLVNE